MKTPEIAVEEIAVDKRAPWRRVIFVLLSLIWIVLAALATSFVLMLGLGPCGNMCGTLYPILGLGLLFEAGVLIFCLVMFFRAVTRRVSAKEAGVVGMMDGLVILPALGFLILAGA